MTASDSQKLAEKIAKILQAESQNNDLASLYASIEKINHRLDKLERLASTSQTATVAPQAGHPSQDRFAIAEAIVDSLFEQNSKEKACTFEPSKPCDHCSMCNSRGF
ncbi:MAG: hypothetical protein ABJB40_14780 [Acidobacteriota bacterium]